MTAEATELFKVGETLICVKPIERRDRISRAAPGEFVKVLQEFAFKYKGEQCQDITVQRGNDAPIAVLVSSGCFKRPVIQP